jgi:hypothetical protein
MSITLAWFTLCPIRWRTSTPWKLIVQRTAAITGGTTSIMLAFTLGPLQEKTEVKGFIPTQSVEFMMYY